MKLALMTCNENSELCQELKREYISEKYNQYVRMIMSDICQELSIDITVITNFNFYKELCYTTMLVINKIWLDNIVKYIINSDISKFVSLVERDMLAQDIFVRLFYARQILDILLKYFIINKEKIDLITDILANRLYWIINDMYRSNTKRYNEVLFFTLNNIYLMIKNIRLKYYKIELDQFCRPLLFYIEKEANEAFYN